MPSVSLAAPTLRSVPWLGVRKFATNLLRENQVLREQLAQLGALTTAELEQRRAKLEQDVAALTQWISREKAEGAAIVETAKRQVADARRSIVETEEMALLQESGVYQYRHPLTDVVGYEKQLADLEATKKSMTLRDGGAVEGTTDWTVNGSVTQGRKMVRDFSKLMLRAFNAEADNLVRYMKPYKLTGALERLQKVSETIERLGKTMKIRISQSYLRVRLQELELTADYLQKHAEQKENERLERERLREERKVQQEIDREKQRLEKERQHYANALEALSANGDADAVSRLSEKIAEVDKAIANADYRAANIRAGYVYLISNIGSFGERMVKLGLTRRLDPMDRIRELSDASVPFNFDVHALFFSTDAVGIETAMHERLTGSRVNLVNKRREFFRATPAEVKVHLGELAGDLLQFQEEPEALEYRQGLKIREPLLSVAQSVEPPLTNPPPPGSAA